jgi:beta-glucosidase
MPGTLERLITAVAHVQPKTVVVLTAGGNVDMSGWIDRVPALLHAWYPGQAGGRAIAEVLFGHVNPSGRLPATFERELEDRSSFDSYHDDDGDRRVALTDGIFGGYRHFDRSGVAPRFPFGFGLCYTSFEIEGLELARGVLEPGEGLELSVLVKNVGARAGAEVVQAYVHELLPSVPRPVKELAGFRKVRLEAGEERRVSVSIAPRAFEFFDVDSAVFKYRPGEFEVLVGRNAADVPLRRKFVVR